MVFFSSEKLTDDFGTGSVNNSFMINDAGDVLVNADFELVSKAVNLSNMPLVKQMRENGDNNRQILFLNDDGKEYFERIKNSVQAEWQFSQLRVKIL